MAGDPTVKSGHAYMVVHCAPTVGFRRQVVVALKRCDLSSRSSGLTPNTVESTFVAITVQNRHSVHL